MIVVHIFRRKKKISFLWPSRKIKLFGKKNGTFNILKERERGRKRTIGEKATMVLACVLKHVSESLPPANTGKFSKLLRR